MHLRNHFRAQVLQYGVWTEYPTLEKSRTIDTLMRFSREGVARNFELAQKMLGKNARYTSNIICDETECHIGELFTKHIITYKKDNNHEEET